MKACTVTSKAECGRCKPGAYAEGMLGLCKPCSPCCYDGKDIIIPECQVPGVPTGLQCSYLRSNKCSTSMTSSISTAPSTLQPDQSTTQWRPFSSTTGTEVISLSSGPTTNMVEENSPNVGSIVGPVVSSFTAFVTILVIVCCKNMRKRRSHQCCHQDNHCHDDQGQQCKVTTVWRQPSAPINYIITW